MSTNASNNHEIVLAAIADAQETIRAYDLKAEILAALITLIVGFVAIKEPHPTPTFEGVIEFLVVISGLLSIFFLGAVLYPANNPVDAIKYGGYVPAGTFYVGPKKISSSTVIQLSNEMESVDWSKELTFELMKVSAIRNRKMDFFKSAQTSACIGYALAVFLYFLKAI